LEFTLILKGLSQILITGEPIRSEEPIGLAEATSWFTIRILVCC